MKTASINSFYVPFQKYIKNDSMMKSQILMMKSGMIRQHVNGIYSILPLGVKILNKLIDIIKKNLEKIGANEVICPTIQSVDLWKESGRYFKYEKEILHCFDKKKKELLYAPTAEDIMTKLMYQDVKSTKQLPLNLYQVQWKFRDEIRPRFGLMRSREFLMMDAYTFSKTKEESLSLYKNYFLCYLNIFKDLGLKVLTFPADNGDVGGDFSHEFYIESEFGESEIDYNKSLFGDEFELYLKKDETYYSNLKSIAPWLFERKNEIKKGIEVGHIFYIGTNIVKNMDLKISDKNDSFIYPEVSSYGIGVTRLLASLIEAFSTEDRIILPKQIRPFDICLIKASDDNDQFSLLADELYNKLQSNGVSAFIIPEFSKISEKIEKAKLIGAEYYIIIGNEYIDKKEINIVRISDEKSFNNVDISNLKNMIS